jgi:hypothetical protein
MSADETNKKEDRTESQSSGPMGSGMFEMMTKCCGGEEAFAECAAMMKSKMAAMTSTPCCGPGTGKVKPCRKEE